MKKILLIALLFFSAITFGQKVTVKGIAIDTTNNRNRVQIVLNDTLSKFFSADLPNYRAGSEIIKNKSLVIRADEKGFFKIKALPTDSLIFTSWQHIRESYLVSDLLKKDNIRVELKPKICVEYIECKEKPKMLYAFVGRKIKVEPADLVYYCNIISMDSKYDAEYKILENLYGNYPKDTIKFVSYDHASIRRYDDYENVLIYVADYCGRLIHVKYQYHDLYKTVDGKWASPYNPYNYRKIDSTFHIKPREIEFEKPIEFNFKEENLELIKKKYLEPYYEIKNGKVKILYGNYTNELFELKKATVLKDRGFFE